MRRFAMSAADLNEMTDGVYLEEIVPDGLAAGQRRAAVNRLQLPPREPMRRPCKAPVREGSMAPID